MMFDLWPVYSDERFRASWPFCFTLTPYGYTGWPLMTTIRGNVWVASSNVPCKSSADKVNWYTFRGCKSAIFSFASLLNEGQLREEYDMSHSI